MNWERTHLCDAHCSKPKTPGKDASSPPWYTLALFVVYSFEFPLISYLLGGGAVDMAMRACYRRDSKLAFNDIIRLICLILKEERT